MLRAAAQFANAQGWQALHLENTTEIMLSDKPWLDFLRAQGLTCGIILFPHPKCEPVLLLFDAKMKMASAVKTQYAPLDVHVAIVNLLRQIEPLFTGFTVHDEGEYWETGDRQKLANQIGQLQQLMNQFAKGLRDQGISVDTPVDTARNKAN